MSGEMPQPRPDELSDLREELEETPGKIEAPEEAEPVLEYEMEDMTEEQIEEIHEQREQVEKTREAAAELFAAEVSEEEGPEEIKKIMGRVDTMSSLVTAETFDAVPEKPLEAREALGDEHKGVNSSYILRLIEKRISRREGTEEIIFKQAILKPMAGAAGGMELIKALWENPDGKAWLSGMYGVKPEGGKKLEDFFPGIEKKSLRPGIERESLHLKEWLASMMDEAMGTGVVPATVLRMEKEGVGSVQDFIPDAVSPCEDPRRQIDDEEMKKMAVFDFVAGSQDKHDSNYLAGKKLPGRETRKAHSIDNGYILSTNSRLGELDIISKPLEQFNPARAEGGRAIDPGLPASLEKSLGKFLRSKKIQGALRKCFDIALGPEAEVAWQGFIARTEKIYSQKRLPTEYDKDQSRARVAGFLQEELLGLVVKAQAEKAA